MTGTVSGRLTCKCGQLTIDGPDLRCPYCGGGSGPANICPPIMGRTDDVVTISRAQVKDAVFESVVAAAAPSTPEEPTRTIVLTLTPRKYSDIVSLIIAGKRSILSNVRESAAQMGGKWAAEKLALAARADGLLDEIGKQVDEEPTPTEREFLPDFVSVDGEDILAAKDTPESGIKIDIRNLDLSEDYAGFFLTTPQAVTLGRFLLRRASMAKE